MNIQRTYTSKFSKLPKKINKFNYCPNGPCCDKIPQIHGIELIKTNKKKQDTKTNKIKENDILIKVLLITRANFTRDTFQVINR